MVGSKALPLFRPPVSAVGVQPPQAANVASMSVANVFISVSSAVTEEMTPFFVVFTFVSPDISDNNTTIETAHCVKPHEANMPKGNQVVKRLVKGLPREKQQKTEGDSTSGDPAEENT